MSLCCEVKPTEQCKTCGNKFCTDHVYKDKNYWAYASTKSVVPAECFSCYQTRVRGPWICASKEGLTAKDLYTRARELCPKGYLSITINIQDSAPGSSIPTIEWQIYHEKHLIFKGTNPESVLESFRAAVIGIADPNKTYLSHIDL